ncbi:MAG: phosphoribosylformylglycinamidine synthase subunit PurS [Actinomycetia bacterium]|nr:phosphoribosylformylglycinamidine synthase subunit PurS [Actinomycetes bacterium]
MTYTVTVLVELHPHVLDPAGQAVADVLRGMGFLVEDVRMGRVIRLRVPAASAEEARRLASEMADRLLANPVMERFAVGSVEP